jgi:UrcA family protein
MVTRFKRRAAAVLAGIGASLVFVNAPASAQYPTIVIQGVPAPNLRIERVPYGDLNLATRAGQEALKLRVSHAVERVCLYDQHRWYGLSEPKYTQCTAGAWSRARPQMIGAISRASQYYAYYRPY